MKIRFAFTVVCLLFFLSACASASAEEVTFHYGDNGQFELIDAEGNRILIDIYKPDLLTSPATEADILLTTHGHPDHIHSDFLSTFPGEQLYIQVGEISKPYATITGIASTHTAYGSDEFKDQNGTNYIYLVEMGELRIAHFGDIGQEEFTTEQLDALGEIDIAITQFVNSFSQMDTTNQKGFNLMEQLKPKMIIPTHGNGNMDAIGHANEVWEVYANSSNSLVISKADLNDTTKVILVGPNADPMQTIHDLPAWETK